MTVMFALTWTMLRVEKGLRLDRDTAGHAPRGAEEELACPGPDGALEACGRQKGAGGFQAGWEKQGQRPYAQGHLQPQVTGQGPCPWGPRSARWESHQAGLREPGKGQAAVGQPPGGRDWDLQRRQHTGHTCEHSHTHRLSRHTLLHIHSHAHRHTPKSQHATGTAANVYTHTHARTHKPHVCTLAPTRTAAPAAEVCGLPAACSCHPPAGPVVSRPWPELP